MNIYNLDRKSIKDMIKEFGSSTYGKTIFFISFFIPMVTGFFTILLFLNYLLAQNVSMAYYYSRYLVIMVVLTILGLISGCKYYYKEFRIFVQSLNNKK